MIPKALQLLGLLPYKPGEFYDRLLANMQTRCESRGQRAVYRPIAMDEFLSEFGKAFREDASARFLENGLTDIEKAIDEGQGEMPGAPFPRFHNGGIGLARVCYAATRIVRPNITVESGVCYGVTSAYFLQALAQNGSGHLHSIDLPPLGRNADSYVGGLVPRELRTWWTLHRGATRRLLAPLVRRLEVVDLFLHDSLHTYSNMRWEFATVWPALRPGGLLIADDVEGNTAFQELSQRVDVSHAWVVQEKSKESMFGVAVKGS